MIEKEIKYCLDDISIVPSEITNILHRGNCNCYVDIYSHSNEYKCRVLPIIVSPMTGIASEEKYETYAKNGIIGTIARNVDIQKRIDLLINGYLVAFSLEETIKLFDDGRINNDSHIIVDVANGHMIRLMETIERIKGKYPYSFIITGNIANPYTLTDYENCGIDAVRLSIGTGSRCLTSINTGIHYPNASLIDECYSIKKQNNYKIKLIADGGIDTYSDMIKCLALGADYVMLGKMIAEIGTSEEISNKIKHEFYGMSTKRAQKEFGKDGNKIPEGFSKSVCAKYTIEEMIDNFKAYLSSAMSYTNSYDLDDFKESKKIVISNKTLQNNLMR